jgi:hypothetical protein
LLKQDICLARPFFLEDSKKDVGKNNNNMNQNNSITNNNMEDKNQVVKITVQKMIEFLPSFDNSKPNMLMSEVGFVNNGKYEVNGVYVARNKDLDQVRNYWQQTPLQLNNQGLTCHLDCVIQVLHYCLSKSSMPSVAKTDTGKILLELFKNHNSYKTTVEKLEEALNKKMRSISSPVITGQLLFEKLSDEYEEWKQFGFTTLRAWTTYNSSELSREDFTSLTVTGDNSSSSVEEWLNNFLQFCGYVFAGLRPYFVVFTDHFLSKTYKVNSQVTMKHCFTQKNATEKMNLKLVAAIRDTGGHLQTVLRAPQGKWKLCDGIKSSTVYDLDQLLRNYLVPVWVWKVSGNI